MPSVLEGRKPGGIAGTVLLKGNDLTPLDLRQSFIHEGFRPGQIVFLDRAFDDALINELARRLLDRGKLAARDTVADPRLLFGCERNGHAR